MGKSSSSSSLSSAGSSDYLLNLVWLGAVLYGIGYFLRQAYIIRIQAIQEFGPVIHEFDPYFNWRATQVSMCCVLCVLICYMSAICCGSCEYQYIQRYTL